MSKLWSNNPSLPPPSTAFSGETYEPARDYVRLTGQLGRVFEAMRDGEWRTLAMISYRVFKISGTVSDSEAAISARLRDLRKAAYGAHTVERRSDGAGLFQYRLIVKGRKAA